MRTEEEFRALVYEKAEHYKKEQKAKRRRFISVASPLLALAVAVTVLYGNSVRPCGAAPETEIASLGSLSGNTVDQSPLTGKGSAGTGTTADSDYYSAVGNGSDGQYGFDVKTEGVNAASSYCFINPVTVRSDSYYYKSGVKLISSKLGFLSYCAKIKNIESGSEEAFAQIKDFFKNNTFGDYNVICVCEVSGSGSTQWEVTYNGLSEGVYSVTLTSSSPEVSTCDMKTTFLFLVVPKGGNRVAVSYDAQ